MLDQKSHFVSEDLLHLLGRFFQNSASEQAAKEVPAPQVRWNFQISGTGVVVVPERVPSSSLRYWLAASLALSGMPGSPPGGINNPDGISASRNAVSCLLE